jgi:hypothetical protein
MNKTYTTKTDLKPRQKKVLNFCEDITRGIMYIVALVFASAFVIRNLSQTLVIISYIIYIVSGALFIALRTIKWIYYYCGKGKKNYLPWSTKTVPLAHAQDKQK